MKIAITKHIGPNDPGYNHNSEECEDALWFLTEGTVEVNKERKPFQVVFIYFAQGVWELYDASVDGIGRGDDVEVDEELLEKLEDAVYKESAAKADVEWKAYFKKHGNKDFVYA